MVAWGVSETSAAPRSQAWAPSVCAAALAALAACGGAREPAKSRPSEDAEAQGGDAEVATPQADSKPQAGPQPELSRSKRSAQQIAELPSVQEQAWREASPEQRLAALREVEAIVAKVDERAPATVELHAFELPEDAPFEYMCGYRIEPNHILLAPRLVESPERSEVVNALLRCAHYAFQAAVLAHPDRYPEIDEQTRTAWARPYVFPPLPGVEEQFDRIYLRRPEPEPQ